MVNKVDAKKGSQISERGRLVQQLDWYRKSPTDDKSTSNIDALTSNMSNSRQSKTIYVR